MSDWRLQGQDQYLQAVALTKKHYVKYRADWEHDHCEFCSIKFSEAEPDALQEGYATDDNYHWVCETCYNDFKKQFGWA